MVCEDVIFSDCELNSRCQTVRLGCSSDDVIRNVLFKNIKAVGSNGIFADYPTRYLNSEETGFRASETAECSFSAFSSARIIKAEP